MKLLLLGFLFGVSLQLRAEEPTVTLYQAIEEDVDHGIPLGELILRVNNPTDRTFYVLGLSITDIPCTVEVLKNGKWEVVPPTRCGFGMTMRKFLPRSSLVFTVNEAPLNEYDITFRLRVYLYTDPDIWNVYKEPARKPYVELLSPEFSTKNFHPKRKQLKEEIPPRLPGVESEKKAN